MLSSISFPSSNLLNKKPLTPHHRRPPFQIKASSAVSMATASPSLYHVLGLSIGANGNEIKAAYRKLARVCHPDVCKSSSSSADEFIRIHAAYSTLSDPCKRADYDRGLAVGGRQQRWTSPRPQGFAGFGRRTWETDQCW